jgi:hypothetical protein
MAVFETAGAPIHGRGRLARIQSAKDGMKPRTARPPVRGSRS